MLRYDFKTGFKLMLWSTLGMMAAYLILFWFTHTMTPNPGYFSTPADRIHFISSELGSTGLFAMFVFSICSACVLFRNVQNKAPRIVMMMLPATNLEKFLSRWVWLVATTLCGTLLAFFAADLLRMAYLAITSQVVDSVLLLLLKRIAFYLSIVSGKDALYLLIGIGMMLTIHSFCLFCGVLFKKYHIPVTALIGIILFIVAILILRFMEMRRIYGHVEIVIGCSEVVLTTLFTYLSYRVFSRWQVVTHKFVNL